MSESLIEAELLKKYFFNIQSKGLQSSNLKVGQCFDASNKTSRQSNKLMNKVAPLECHKKQKAITKVSLSILFIIVIDNDEFKAPL